MADPSNCLAITGADGFLAWHLRCRIHPGVPRLVLPEDFESVERLAQAIGPATTVFHLAGMNRGPETDVYETNIRLAHLLVEALDRTGTVPTLLFANSIHSLGDSPFGKSKREASRILAEWARSRGGRYVDVILPHIFGEGAKPFYNSGFATFCHQLSRGEEPQIHQNGELELIHAQRVAARFLELAQGQGPGGTERLAGIPMRVSEALGRLRSLDATYREGIIPQLSAPLTLEFFNTYRSYLFPDHYPVPVRLNADERGGLFEAVKSMHGGQTFVSTTRPGVTRGRHYHHRKVERFLVISGQAEIRVRRLLEPGIRTFRVSGEEPCFIDMPTFHTHEITNVGGQDLLTLFWSHELYDPSSPDTYSESVTLGP